MCTEDAPPPPNPEKTAAAATGTNINTAIANAYLGGVNQIGPDGSKIRTQTGTKSVTDPYTGKTYEIPTFTETTTLSEQQQALKGLNDQSKMTLAQTGVNAAQRLQGLVGSDFKLGNEATEARLMDLGSKRLNPQFQQSEEALRARLANQGLQPGSQAWESEMRRFSEGKNDAYNQLALTGRQQAVNESLTERNQGFNEISALMGGSQVSQPTFGNVNMPTIPTTDVAGIINTNYNQQLQATQMNNANSNALMGGLLGLGSAGIYKFSDERLKENIEKVGKTKDGQNLYSYNYIGDGDQQIGLMAHEVEKRKPSAVVTTPSGFKAVNYSKALGLMGAR